MLKPQNIPYGRQNDYILKFISVEILVKVVRWNFVAYRKGICLIWSRGRLFPPSLPCPGETGIRKQLGTISSWYKRTAGRNLGVNRHGTTLRQRVQRYRYWLYFFSPFGIWSVHVQMSVDSKTYHVEGIMLRLASRTRALWESFFCPPPMHAHSSSFARDDASLAPATPTKVVSEGERNPKKVGPCIDRELLNRKDQVSVEYDI